MIKLSLDDLTNSKYIDINKIMHQPYFVQTQQWAKFWQLANPINHLYDIIEVQNDGFWLSFLICQYPWHFGQKLWYISKGGVLTNIKGEINNWSSISKNELENILISLIRKVNSEAKKKNITYIKYDFEEELIAKLELTQNTDMLCWLKARINPKTILSDKIIQFLATMTLSFEPILKIQPIQDYNKENLSKLWDDTKEFWNKANNNVKRYTKKSIEKDWTISTEKTQTNFEKFFKIYNYTKDIRHFAIQSRDYLEKLFDQDFSKIIILSDSDGEPHCVWFGIQIGNTLTYLYGGNTTKSFDHYGQYLVHLVALNLGLMNKAKFYDLGGYDPHKGYGKFKDNYKGIIRTFAGPFDIPINRLKYDTINAIIHIIKKLKLVLKKQP